MNIIETNPYSYWMELKVPFEEALKRAETTFIKQEFVILSRIDMQAQMKKTLGEKIPPYTILALYNPRLASRAIETEPNIGVVLPSHVLVRENGASTMVVAQKIETIGQLVPNPRIDGIAQIANA